MSLESVHICRPLGHFRDGPYGRPYTVAQAIGETLRLAHCQTRLQAWAIRDQWRDGLYEAHPGELRHFNQPKEGETA